MSALVRICAIFLLITHCIVGQTTGSVHGKVDETFTVGSSEETVTGSSGFSTGNTEAYTVHSSEGTDTTHTGSSGFSTGNTEVYTVHSSEGTDTTHTGSSGFSTGNTEAYTVHSSEGTDTTHEGSSSFSTGNTEAYTVHSSEETDTTHEGSSGFSTGNTEANTVHSSEEADTTHAGSSSFSTGNTEAYTGSSSEGTDTTSTGFSTFSTENTEMSTGSSSEGTDTLSTGSSTFITENTETSTIRSSEETGTTVTGSSTFMTDNSETPALTSSEKTDTTVEDSEYLSNNVFAITPVREYLRQRLIRSTGSDNNDLESNSTSDTTTPFTTTETESPSTTVSTTTVSSTLAPCEAPGPVENLKIDDNILHPDYINITWSEPKEYKTCIDNYRYEVQHNGNTVFDSRTRDTYIVIYKPDTCVEHTYIVFAEGSGRVSDQRNVTYDKVKVNNPPKCAGHEFKNNLLITNWTIGDNVCNPDKFYVNCSTEQSDIVEEGFKLQDMFIAHFYDLKPYTTYNCCGIFENKKGKSSCGHASIQTEAKEPSSPSKLIVTLEKENIFKIRWNEPSSWHGKPEQYNVTIEYLESTYYVPNECTVHTDPFIQLIDFPTSEAQTNPLVYSAKYKISVRAKSSGGWGNVTEETSTTLTGIPEPVRGLKCFLNINRDYTYEAYVTVTWNSPCKSNGPLRYFEIKLCKHRKDTSNNETCKNYNSNVINKSEYERVFKSLEAEYDYALIIYAHNYKHKSNPEICSFATPAGVPKKPIGDNIFKMKSVNTTTAEIHINSEMFSSDMGVIRYFAIIVAEKGCEEDPKDGLFDPKNWPVISSNCYFQNKVKAYQATTNYWNPFINIYKTQDKTFTLGEDVSCNNTNVPCNRPLTPNTDYVVKIRGFTNYGYSDTTFVSFSTVSESTNESGVDVGLIVGIIIGILAIAFLIAGALFYKNGRIQIKNWPRMDSESQISPTPPPVPIKKFDSHYRKMSENSGKIRSEFQLLSTISSDVTLSTKTASLPDNKKKNRYVNILPYDETRVILNVTNSSSSDYINASYIQGYSGNNEYIAAQGPTEATCPAFWQMILEQNVRVIVMLTQCVENGKDKCYKYFPTVVEEYDLNNDIKIECIEEQLFTVYNRRTFKVIKNKVAKKIIHLQFNLWPDFDVPDDVSKMIEFYETVKEINMKKPSLILIHCSAGVGRTGTLIAIDILTQNIRDKRKVDIFGTVLNLRKQRMTMVQSERQYEFLFKCVHYIILKNGNMSNERISESNM